MRNSTHTIKERISIHSSPQTPTQEVRTLLSVSMVITWIPIYPSLATTLTLLLDLTSDAGKGSRSSNLSHAELWNGLVCWQAEAMGAYL